MTAGLMFLAGVALGSLLNAVWRDVLELLDLYREER
jgi:hypothetical protein